MHGNNNTSAPIPDLGVHYPFKVGKSLRNPTASRDLLALKFKHIPSKASVTSPLTLSRHGDKCTVDMQTTDGNSSVRFEGSRRTHGADSRVSDYVLVFVDGVMWLERAADYFTSIRPLDVARTDRPPVEYPEGVGEDDVGRDPDSWMADGEEGGSPVTLEEVGVIEEKNSRGSAGAGGDGAVASSQGKRLISAGRVNEGGSVAGKSVAAKSLPGMGLANGGGRRPQEEEDGGTSSDDEDSDSDSSDSDDSDGSCEYTDRSSDEE